MRREQHSMIHGVVNYRVTETIPRGRPRTTWLKTRKVKQDVCVVWLTASVA